MLESVDVNVVGEVQQIHWSFRVIKKEAHRSWIKLVFLECFLQFVKFDTNEVFEDEKLDLGGSWFREGVMRNQFVFEFGEDFFFGVDITTLNSGLGVGVGISEDSHERLLEKLQIDKDSIDDFIIGISNNRLHLSRDVRALLMVILLLLLLDVVVQT